jgi:hypothetical protein
MMTFKMKKTLIFQSTLVLLLTFLNTNISQSETFKPVPEEVYDELCDFYDETSYECELKPSMLVWIDLNLDGEMEILIDGRNMLAYQSSDGYITWLFNKKENKFALLNRFWGYDIKVLNSKTNGYFDLSQDYKDHIEPEEGEKGVRTNKRIYKFNKSTGEYVLSGES